MEYAAKNNTGKPAKQLYRYRYRYRTERVFDEVCLFTKNMEKQNEQKFL
jgi:hypothetical protein